MESLRCTAVGETDFKGDYHESDNDSGFERTSACSLENLAEEDDGEMKELNEEDEECEKVKRLICNLTDESVARKLNSMKLSEAREFMKRYLGKYYEMFDGQDHFFIDMIIFAIRPGNSDCAVPPRPDWLDMDKFRKGQKFACDHLAGIFYSQLYGLIFLFSFVEDMKTLIFTGKSHTPYLSFKRYLSTGIRIRNWYTGDPWTEGTTAYKDIQAVRRMHNAVEKHVNKLDDDKFNEGSTLKNPVCPLFDVIAKDLSDSCSAFISKQYRCIYESPEKFNKINQSALSLTLFGFMGLIVLYPADFGIHDASDEDLENFCHVWRGIGYLLGINDEVNVCRGSLEEVQQRARMFIEHGIKPSLGRITKEWEHMLRCVIQGTYYYFVPPTYENLVYSTAEILGISMPTLYATLTYRQWISHYLSRFFNRYLSRLPLVRYIANVTLNYHLDRALLYDEAKHEDLKKKSAKWLSNFS